jgi:hypothetical protein
MGLQCNAALPNNSMQRTALRAADAERCADKH